MVLAVDSPRALLPAHFWMWEVNYPSEEKSLKNVIFQSSWKMHAYIILEGIFTLDSDWRLGRRKNLLRHSQCIRRNRQDSWEVCEILLTGNVLTLYCQIIVALWLLDGLKELSRIKDSPTVKSAASPSINHYFRINLMTVWINYAWHNGKRSMVCWRSVNTHQSSVDVNWNKVAQTTCDSDFPFT